MGKLYRREGSEVKLIDQVEKQKRVYQVSLMLRRKPRSFIVEFMRQNWGIERAQAYRYISLARKEWRKYFEKLEGDGISYHVAQFRDIKDQAYSKKVVIGKGEKRINEETGKLEIIYDKQQIITVADLGLVFEIAKEEAKLMGIYPAERHRLDIPEVINVKVDLTE